VKFEIVFTRNRENEKTNELIEGIFGKDCNIDWRDKITVEIESNEISSISEIRVTEIKEGDLRRLEILKKIQELKGIYLDGDCVVNDTNETICNIDELCDFVFWYVKK